MVRSVIAHVYPNVKPIWFPTFCPLPHPLKQQHSALRSLLFKTKSQGFTINRGENVVQNSKRLSNKYVPLNLVLATKYL